MSVLLQISDTHFGTGQGAVVDALDPLARQRRTDGVVLSGNITQRARPAQFRAARAFAERLGAPSRLTGNTPSPRAANTASSALSSNPPTMRGRRPCASNQWSSVGRRFGLRGAV
jgi:3',5'-cyclic AMP phosphodiesterase CpdA